MNISMEYPPFLSKSNERKKITFSYARGIIRALWMILDDRKGQCTYEFAVLLESIRSIDLDTNLSPLCSSALAFLYSTARYSKLIRRYLIVRF